MVARNKAKNELAQMMAKDPLPLERAKITTAAAQKKAERSFVEAEAALEEAKKKGGAGLGDLWWMEREIKEAKKYMPQSKGGRK